MVAATTAALMGTSQLNLGVLDGRLKTPGTVFIQWEGHCAGWSSIRACAENPVLFHETDGLCGQGDAGIIGHSSP